MTGIIRTGIGGWTFEPWRGVFFPKGVRQADELAYASARLGSIEINGTYYSEQKPQTFAKWKAETPDNFVFSVKASRFCTNRKVLADSAPSIERFMKQGLEELGDKLGPILWQFMSTKKFDPVDFAAFLALLPSELAGRPLRHVVDVRNESFIDPAFVALCRERGVAICACDHPTYPLIPDVTADFVYVRLMQGADHHETCYPDDGIGAWAGRLKAWADGGAPADLALADGAPKPSTKDRDVFAYFIQAGKVRAPFGAIAVAERLKA